MQILLNKKTIIEMIERYYSKYLDIKGKGEIAVSKDFKTYGKDEIEDCILTIRLKGKMHILGREQDTIITLSIEEVIEIIKYYIEEMGYEYTDYSIDKGLKEEITGYGPGETKTQEPYFHGIEIGVKVNNKVKEKKKNES